MAVGSRLALYLSAAVDDFTAPQAEHEQDPEGRSVGLCLGVVLADRFCRDRGERGSCGILGAPDRDGSNSGAGSSIYADCRTDTDAGTHRGTDTCADTCADA